MAPALAKPARAWVAPRVASGEWASEAAYVSRDWKDAERLTALHAAIDEGDTSEISDLTIKQIFEETRARHLHKAR